MSNTPFRTGFVAIVGRPNVGKSTLTNALIGSKISIVSRKAQTTRHRIHGVLTREHEQFVFVDARVPDPPRRHEPHDEPGRDTGAGRRGRRGACGRGGQVVGRRRQAAALLPAPERTILVVSKIDALKNRDDLFAFVSKIGAASVRRRGAGQRDQEPAAGSTAAGNRHACLRTDVRRGHADRPSHALIAAELVREDLPSGGR